MQGANATLADTTQLYGLCERLMSLLFIAMADDTEDETPEPTLFEQLGGTEMPNTIVDDVLTVTRNTLGIFINMVAD
jgi:hypothetical protein